MMFVLGRCNQTQHRALRVGYYRDPTDVRQLIRHHNRRATIRFGKLNCCINVGNVEVDDPVVRRPLSRNILRHFRDTDHRLVTQHQHIVVAAAGSGP